MIIVKFGGSVITDKGKECTFAPDVTNELVSELARFLTIQRKENKIINGEEHTHSKNYDLILVHGAGSFGHIKAKYYGLNNGYENDDQYFGISQVHRDVRELNIRFMDVLLEHRLPGLAIPPMASLKNSDKEISSMDIKIFQDILNLNLIPISYGDVVLDEKLGFSICSGDLIIKKLAEAYKPEQVIFLTDVDGLFSSHPVLDTNNAELITKLTKESFTTAITDQQINPDVTGGIYLKGRIALELAELGINSYIINGKVTSRFRSALTGDDVLGTIAKPKN